MNLRSLVLSHSRNAGWTSVLCIFSSLPGVSWYSKDFGQTYNRKPRIVFFRGELSSLFMPMPWTNEGYNQHLEIHSPYKQSTTHSPFMSGFPAWNSHSWAFFVVEAMLRTPSWTRWKSNCLRSLQRLLLASCEKGFLAVFVLFFLGSFCGKFLDRCNKKWNEAESFMFVLRLLKDIVVPFLNHPLPETDASLSCDHVFLWANLLLVFGLGISFWCQANQGVQ